jgi:hypothetical protein
VPRVIDGPHLERDVGGDVGEAAPGLFRGQAPLPDEADVGSTDGVGVVLETKASVGCDEAGAVLLVPSADESKYFAHHGAVAEGGYHFVQLAADQLISSPRQ